MSYTAAFMFVCKFSTDDGAPAIDVAMSTTDPGSKFRTKMLAGIARVALENAIATDDGCDCAYCNAVRAASKAAFEELSRAMPVTNETVGEAMARRTH